MSRPRHSYAKALSRLCQGLGSVVLRPRHNRDKVKRLSCFFIRTCLPLLLKKNNDKRILYFVITYRTIVFNYEVHQSSTQLAVCWFYEISTDESNHNIVSYRIFCQLVNFIINAILPLLWHRCFSPTSMADYRSLQIHLYIF